MNKNQKVLTGLAVTAIILIMLRKRIATALNTTSFAAVSDMLFNVISKFEGFFAVPYWDRTGYSVGYGSQYNWDQKRPVVKTDVIDKATAKNWLLQEAQQNFSYVQSKIKVPVTDNQILALSSFAYNVGQGAFSNSTLLELLNKGDIKQNNKPIEATEQNSKTLKTFLCKKYLKKILNLVEWIKYYN